MICYLKIVTVSNFLAVGTAMFLTRACNCNHIISHFCLERVSFCFDTFRKKCANSYCETYAFSGGYGNGSSRGYALCMVNSHYRSYCINGLTCKQTTPQRFYQYGWGLNKRRYLIKKIF